MSVLVRPSEVLTADGAPLEPGPCPICQSDTHAGPEGTAWSPDWHCWKCGWRDGQHLTTVAMLHQAGADQVQMLARAKEDIGAMLMSKLAEMQAEQSQAQTVNASPDEVAALREQVAALTARLDSTGGGD